MKKLYGTAVPIVTPFDDEGNVDVPSLESLTEYIVGSGLQCLYPCGTTGEMCLLTQEERKLVVETVVKKTAGRIPVFAQVGAMTLKDTVELARHAVEAGCDGVGVVTPIYFKLSDRGLIDYYTTVARSLPEDFPMYLYGIPQNAVNDISVQVAEEVAKACKNVVGIKYSYPNMTRLQKFMLVNDEQFSVLVGPDHLFQAVTAVGGDGVVSGNAMIIPEHYVKLWEALRKGDQMLALRLQRRTNVLNGILCEKNNISAYKVLLREMGIIRTANMRAPMEEMTPEEEQKLLDDMNRADYRRVLI
ncbi:MAG TPA: dihydrodipicolinate synthase family protein [Candidatus Egerieimonas intestinavium]|uniref:Dihydrodipicolinate synthase family protein n=1 Tax=Candidatus Egerieimonas intestinavium TaxID=2840777 RepID=A0A9D1EJQ8_9FIRM|nr:dihydrodipicolinate synthase family protein [Candidatus Egerieimonas intestinavium]